jgi:hypothetical protein
MPQCVILILIVFAKNNRNVLYQFIEMQSVLVNSFEKISHKKLLTTDFFKGFLIIIEFLKKS